MTASGTRYAFSVEDWHRMGEAGLFDEDSRVELLDGEVVWMSPIGSRHASCVNRLNHLLVLAVGTQAIVSVQNPVRLDDWSEPQPDFALLHPQADYYAAATPRPEDTFLLVEVADSSLAWDRDRKAPRYGATGVPAYWVIDLGGDEVLVHGGAGPAGYGDLHHAQRGEMLEVPGRPGVAFSVDDLLGLA